MTVTFDIFRTMETFLVVVLVEEVVTVGMIFLDGVLDQLSDKESSQVNIFRPLFYFSSLNFIIFSKVKRFTGLQPLVAAGISRLRSLSLSPLLH